MNASRPFFSAILFLLILSSFGWAQQAQPDDVHINPPVTSATPDKSIPANSVVTAGLKQRNDHMKVKVDMVLVPVTITDPMNRLVTGLDKENFTLFQDKNQQIIRDFSSEDAPVSI